jgi:hypothetical protein
MLTAAEINAATGDALQRLIARVTDAAYEDARDTNQKFEDSLVAAAATDQSVVGALERVANAVEAVANRPVLSPKQQLWVDLYQTHLKTRKDPAVISSTTGDPVIKDIVLDAAMMTNEVFPHVKAAMAALQVPPGGVDWT